MKGRDLVILGAVLLIAAVAGVDALRNDDSAEPEAAETAPPPPPARTVVEPSPRVFEGLPLPGSLVFTDADGCRLRAVELSSGSELDLPRLAGDCTLWAPPVGPHIAYGLGARFSDAVPFRLVDLSRPRRSLGGYSALFGFLTWSGDGRRVAWCGESRAGFDLELGGAARRLSDCPSAFTPDGRVAFARRSRLVSASRTLVRARGAITFVRWGADSSLALVLGGRRIERRAAGRLTGSLELPPELEGRQPIFSPDNCAALFRREERTELVELGCFGGEAPQEFFGGAVAWSPDGEWIAIAEQQTIAFHRVVGVPEVLRLPAAAAELAWQS